MPSLLHLGRDALTVVFDCVLAAGYKWSEDNRVNTDVDSFPHTFPGRNERDLLMINKTLYQIVRNLVYERILLDFSTSAAITAELSSFLLRSPPIAGEIKSFEFRSYEYSEGDDRNANRCMDVPVQQMMALLQSGAVNLQHLTLIGDWSPLPALLATRQLRSLTLKMYNCAMTVVSGVIQQNSKTLEKLVLEERACVWEHDEQTESILLGVNGMPLLRSVCLNGVSATNPDTANTSFPKLVSIQSCIRSSWLWQSSAHTRNLSISLQLCETPDQDAWNSMMLTVQAQLPPSLKKLRVVGRTRAVGLSCCEDEVQSAPLSLLADLPTSLEILELEHFGQSTTSLVQELLANPYWLQHLSQIKITAERVYEDYSDYDSCGTNDTCDDTFEMRTGIDGQRCLVRL